MSAEKKISRDDVARAVDELAHSDVVMAAGALLEYGLRQVAGRRGVRVVDEAETWPDATTPPGA